MANAPGDVFEISKICIL